MSKKSKFDFGEIEQLRDDLVKMSKSNRKFIEDFLLQMANRALAKTKKRTPVDSGNLRKNWKVDGVFKAEGILYVVLYNQVEYAGYVENGHRTVLRKDESRGWVEGYFMATISIAEIEKEMPVRYQRAFDKYLKELGLK